MLQVTMNELLNSNEAMRNIATKELPIKISYQISRIINKMESELKIFEDLKRKIFTNYGENTKDGQIRIKDENREKFQKEMRILLDTSVEIYGNKIELENFNEIKINAIDLLNLKFLIIDKNEEEKVSEKEVEEVQVK